MSTNAEQATHSPVDKVRLGLSIALVLGSLAAYYALTNTSGALRLIGILVAFAAAVVVSFSSSYGRQLREFIAESHFELRKVVWPTRQETTQTTIVIFIVVTIVSLLLFLFDSALAWIFGALFGSGS
jgi:preprotein translocase subunit SecE